MIRTTAIAILLSSTAFGAFAGTPEPVTVAPVVAMPAPAPFWEGGYIGAQIGYAYGDFNLGSDTFNNDNAIGGLTAGYLWSMGNGWYLCPVYQ